jgi:hypothetical protein
VPFQERTADGVHRFCDFMSSNWPWKQAVSSRYCLLFTVNCRLRCLGHYCREGL